MSDKLKVYSVSALAIRPLRSGVDSPEYSALERASMTEFAHRAAIYLAHSTEELTTLALAEAHKTWPESEGWNGHQLSFGEVTTDFYEYAFRVYYSGGIDFADAEENSQPQAIQ